MGKRLIIINRMYAGDFFEEKNNIGGEVINLIRDDNGDNYIWLNPHGKCDPDIIKEYDEIYVLLVMKYAPWKWKILGKSKIDKEASLKIMSKQADKDSHKAQITYIQDNNIKYGGIEYHKISEGNTKNGKSIYEKALFLTFKSEKIWVPDITEAEKFANIIFNTYYEYIDSDDESENNKNKYKKGLTPRPLFMFLHDEDVIKKYNKNGSIDSNENTLLKTYNFINDIIGNDKNSEFIDDGIKKSFKWKELPIEETAESVKSNENIYEDYFLKVIREEDRELAFSNMLAYFLRDNNILESFVNSVLDVKDFDVMNASVTREEKNIDILISSNSHKIIIENKIKSGLIQKNGGMKSKLDEYFSKYPDIKERLGEEFKEEHLQTDRYYAYALSQAQKDGIAEDNIIGYILVPNYNRALIEKEKEKAIYGHKFDIITYKEVQPCFEKFKNTKYMDEFLKAIKKHTNDIDNSIEGETKYNFCKRIEAIKTKKSPLC